MRLKRLIKITRILFVTLCAIRESSLSLSTLKWELHSVAKHIFLSNHREACLIAIDVRTRFFSGSLALPWNLSVINYRLPEVVFFLNQQAFDGEGR